MKKVYFFVLALFVIFLTACQFEQPVVEDEVQEEPRKFVTRKSIIWFLIALIGMTGYYWFLNWGLMKVQGLDFYYLWVSGV